MHICCRAVVPVHTLSLHEDGRVTTESMKSYLAPGVVKIVIPCTFVVLKCGCFRPIYMCMCMCD